MVQGIPKNKHGWIDYSYVPVTLLAPTVIGFRDEKWAANLCYLSAFASLGYSLLTDARWGAFKLIPYRSHALLDLGIGVATIATIAVHPVEHKKAKATLLVMGLTGVVVGILSWIGFKRS
ncbi:MAG TPA: hypothetical protein VHK91_10340 [Flavisolibacter sp.]|jgi:hypothetical protein|nr:hypothetical protein [Flavisolibacter sp.]